MNSRAMGLAMFLAVSHTASEAAYAQAPEGSQVVPAARADLQSGMRGDVVKTSLTPPMPRWMVSLFSHTGYPQQGGFNLFSDRRSVAGGGIGVERRLLALGRTGLSARLELTAERSEGAWSGGQTQFEGSSVSVGGMVDVVFAKYVRPYAQLMLGMATGEAQVAAGSFDLAGKDRVPLGTGAIGLRLISRPDNLWFQGPNFAFSGFIEGGYSIAPKFDFTLTARDRSPEDIPLQSVALGQLGRSRPHVRLGLAVHF